MEQTPAAPDQGLAGGPADEQDRAFAAIVRSIERLDELGLADDRGHPTVEPASAFRWS
jgi:hypothetical protein